MTDITTLPIGELLCDLEETKVDIRICELALTLDVTAYSGGDVDSRLRTNLKVKEAIESELKRRAEIA